MNTDLLKEHWPEAKERLQHRWGQLTAEDLSAIDGDFPYLVRVLQERYGYARERAQREAHVFVARLGATEEEAASLFESARESMGPGARKIKEGFEELAAGMREFAREARERGGDKFSDGAAQAGDRVKETAADVAMRGQHLLESSERFIRERPLTAVGIAFVAGFVLLGRRS